MQRGHRNRRRTDDSADPLPVLVRDLYVCFNTETDQAKAVAIYDPPPETRSLFEQIRDHLRF